MSDNGNPSRYVKLTKEQSAPTEDIRPGELNQPIDVPQVSLHTFYIYMCVHFRFNSSVQHQMIIFVCYRLGCR